MGKESACNAGDEGSVLGSGDFFGGGHGNPLLSSSWENPMDRGTWWTTVHRVAKSQTRLKRLNTHAHTHELETLHQNPGLAIGHPNLK